MVKETLLTGEKPTKAQIAEIRAAEAVSNLASNFQAGGRHSKIMCGASTKSRRAGPAAAVSRLI